MTTKTREPNYAQEYRENVIKAGDEASGNFKEICNQANSKLDIRKYLEYDGKFRHVHTGNNSITSVTETIDGVGTKVQIYTNVFNNLIQTYENGKISEEALFATSSELWERMLHDLIAMNVDDLRNGEMAVAVTNIIDINHLKGTHGKVFAETMAEALGKVIKEVDIAMTAGETAILGEPKKVNTLNTLSQELQNQLRKLLESKEANITESAKEEILNILDQNKQQRIQIMQELELNIGGTGLGILPEKEKLVPLKPGQAVLALQEKPTEKGIIGPRANGISSIRNYMKTLVGEGRELLSFEEFLGRIGEKADNIPTNIKNECAGLQMWDIATGRTTIFNPFVSRELLGGVEREPLVHIAAISHITGNPLKKLKEGIKGKGEKDFGMQINAEDIKLPHIIAILQHVCEIDDTAAISSWNMGIPYTIVCEQSDVRTVIQLAEKQGFMTKPLGTITENGKIQIDNIGIGKTSISS